MSQKTLYYAQLAEDTARRLTGSWERWAGFLATAGRLYKYPYPDQLMIYAQRPDATACASYDVWNDRMNRYVRRGSKGIALLDDAGDRLRLRYVFDLADTGTRSNSRDPWLWTLEDRHMIPVAAMLERRYGTAAADLPQQLADAAGQLADAYWAEHGQEISASLQIPCWRSTMNSTEGLPSNGPPPPAPHLPSCPGAGTPPKTTLEPRLSETFMSSTRRPPWLPWALPSARAAGRCCCRSRQWSGKWNATSQKKGDFGMSSTALQYTQNGDYLVPNIELNQPQTPLGKYGRMRKTYLKENRPILYNHLLLCGKLYLHLVEIDRTAKDRLDRQMEELLKQNPAPDKAAQQMAWVQHMNALKMQAKEAILNELIYS